MLKAFKYSVFIEVYVLMFFCLGLISIILGIHDYRKIRKISILYICKTTFPFY